MDFIVTIQGSAATATIAQGTAAATIRPAGSAAILAPQGTAATLAPDTSRVVTLHTGQPGRDGAGLPWVVISQADYEALSTPNAGTIYDVILEGEPT